MRSGVSPQQRRQRLNFESPKLYSFIQPDSSARIPILLQGLRQGHSGHWYRVHDSLLPLRKGRVMCRAMTFNIKGLKRDSFVVDGSNRRIVNLPGRYVCYWINGKQDSATIYNRPYRKSSDGSYVHNSRNAKSEVAFDGEGLEKRAENLVSGPRRYHEIFVRLFRF